jgi:histone H3/H4
MTSRKNVEEIVEQIKRKEKVQEIAIQKLCETVKEILKEEPNTVRI